MEGKLVIPLNVYRMDRLDIRIVRLSAEVKVNNLSGFVEVDLWYHLRYKNSAFSPIFEAAPEIPILFDISITTPT